MRTLRFRRIVAGACVSALVLCTPAAARTQTPAGAAAPAAPGQKPGPARRPKAKDRDPEILSLVSDARTLAPELAAATLLKITKSPRFVDRKWKREVLGEAYDLASRAQHPIRLVAAPSSQVDTLDGFLVLSLQPSVDRLSLQSECVLSMVELDPAEARSMLDRSVRSVELPEPECGREYMPDISPYYLAVTKVFEAGFTGAERARNDHVFFLDAEIARTHTWWQVAPATELALRGVGHRVWRDKLAASLAAALRSLDADPDAMFHVLLSPKVPGSLARLLTALGPDSAASTELRDALTQGVDRTLKSGLCFPKGTSRHNLLTRALARLAAGVQTPAFQLEDVAARRGTARYAAVPLWGNETARTLLSKTRALRLKSDGTAYTDEERAMPAWRGQLGSLLADIRAWQPKDAAEERTAFHEKAVIYKTLSDLVPAGPSRDSVLIEYVRFLAKSHLQTQAPAEWLLHANYFLDLSARGDADRGFRLPDVLSESGSHSLRTLIATERFLKGAKQANP